MMNTWPIFQGKSKGIGSFYMYAAGRNGGRKGTYMRNTIGI